MASAPGTSAPQTSAGFGWFAIARIGLVQACIGALVMMVTTVLNRLMVVEYSLAAAIPAGLVAWHYAVQLGRPIWGHGSDQGKSRTPWIIGGMVVLAIGALLATQATLMMAEPTIAAFVLAVLAYMVIGIGVGAAIKPFTPERLIDVALVLAAVAIAVTIIATWRLDNGQHTFAETSKQSQSAPDFRAAVAEIFAEQAARRFTVFIFVSMMAYNMQDLILEPFAGQIFGMAPGESTKLGGMLNAGGLVGMIVAGVGGSAFKGRMPSDLRFWIVSGCLGSALGLAGLAAGAVVGPDWPLTANVLVLGFCNGVFAVAAIGAMMGLAGAGEKTREGVRMGVWGASQAIAFGFAGLLGAAGRDVALFVLGDQGRAYQIVFAAEGVLFVVAAMLALLISAPVRSARPATQIHSEPKPEAEAFA